jgi:hypothetical protein
VVKRRRLMPDLKQLNPDTLPAGRELDALVAERVMGWKRVGFMPDGCPVGTPNLDYDDGFIIVLPYSTSIAAALPIAEKMGFGMLPGSYFEDGVFRGLPTAGEPAALLGVRPGIMASAETLPLAICRAALKVRLHEA